MIFGITTEIAKCLLRENILNNLRYSDVKAIKEDADSLMIITNDNERYLSKMAGFSCRGYYNDLIYIEYGVEQNLINEILIPTLKGKDSYYYIKRNYKVDKS